MARPQRKRLKFDEESVNKLLQEIYEDSHNIRAKIIRLFNKWETKVKENGEVAAIGDQIVKLIAAEAKNQDQKIMLLKYLKEVVFDNKVVGKDANGVKHEDGEEDVVDSKRRNELLHFVAEELRKKEREKSLKNE